MVGRKEVDIMTVYSSQNNTTLTSRQIRLMSSLLAVLTSEQVDQLIESLREVREKEYGVVTLRFKNGQPRFIETTTTKPLVKPIRE